MAGTAAHPRRPRRRTCAALSEQCLSQMKPMTTAASATCARGCAPANLCQDMSGVTSITLLARTYASMNACTILAPCGAHDRTRGCCSTHSAHRTTNRCPGTTMQPPMACASHATPGSVHNTNNTNLRQGINENQARSVSHHALPRLGPSTAHQPTTQQATCAAHRARRRRRTPGGQRPRNITRPWASVRPASPDRWRVAPSLCVLVSPSCRNGGIVLCHSKHESGKHAHRIRLDVASVQHLCLSISLNLLLTQSIPHCCVYAPITPSFGQYAQQPICWQAMLVCHLLDDGF